MNPKDQRRALIAKIKIAQKQLDLDDDTYRAMLMRVAGANSCTKMDMRQLEAVLAELVAKGFAPTKKHTAPKRRSSADAMMGKIGALLADGKKPWAYAHAMAKRMFGVDRVEWLTDEHMHKLVAALQIAANRQKAKEV